MLGVHRLDSEKAIAPPSIVQSLTYQLPSKSIAGYQTRRAFPNKVRGLNTIDPAVSL
jgi:hypothetical protein